MALNYITETRLCLRVRPSPRQLAASPQLGHLSVQLMSENYGQRHAFLRLVCRVAEHETLVSGPDLVLVTPLVHALGDVR